MHTKDKLAAALREAELEVMATKAEGGWYDDYLSPEPFPLVMLEVDLKEAGTPAALALVKRALNGEFDATPSEAEEWAHSEDGRATFQQMGAVPKV